MRSARPSARAGRRSTPAGTRTSTRSGRRARRFHRSFTWQLVSLVRSSTEPACRPRRPSWRSTRTPTRRSSRSPTSAWSATSSRSSPGSPRRSRSERADGRAATVRRAGPRRAWPFQPAGGHGGPAPLGRLLAARLRAERRLAGTAPPWPGAGLPALDRARGRVRCALLRYGGPRQLARWRLRAAEARLGAAAMDLPDLPGPALAVRQHAVVVEEALGQARAETAGSLDRALAAGAVLATVVGRRVLTAVEVSARATAAASLATARAAAAASAALA